MREVLPKRIGYLRVCGPVCVVKLLSLEQRDFEYLVPWLIPSGLVVRHVQV
jgi:hypothetical protein